MEGFSAYSIPIQGLKTGMHHFEFTLDKTFFCQFEEAPISESELVFEVTLDKRHDMLLFDFDMKGWFATSCDRCTAAIHLPIQTERNLVVKYGEQEGETEDEVVFIERETPKFNLASYLYEFSLLSLPITNTYNCEEDTSPPCNKEVLKYLNNETQEEKQDSVWDVLKEINKN
jgi:uncharacterized metal-binding protein YceD (DUF177 family)